MTIFFLTIGLVIFLLLFEVPVAFSFGLGALFYGVLTGRIFLSMPVMVIRKSGLFRCWHCHYLCRPAR